jgi:hypothetical protein
MLGKKDIEWFIKILSRQDERITSLERELGDLHALLTSWGKPQGWAEPQYAHHEQLTLFDQEALGGEAEPQPK